MEHAKRSRHFRIRWSGRRRGKFHWIWIWRRRRSDRADRRRRRRVRPRMSKANLHQHKQRQESRGDLRSNHKIAPQSSIQRPQRHRHLVLRAIRARIRIKRHSKRNVRGTRREASIGKKHRKIIFHLPLLRLVRISSMDEVTKARSRAVSRTWGV